MRRAALAMLIAGALYPAASAQQPASAPVTFSKDVAPILQKSCQTCHRPGAIAPMSLLTYQDARPWARSIKAKVTAREMPAPRQFSDVDKWHIGKPDMVVSLPKPYELKAAGPDEFYDVDVDPGFAEDMYISAVETKPEPYSFKVVHHATANMIEDEDVDPVCFFFNEYALGKNGDIFPDGTGRLIKAGSKIHFNLHLHPSGERSLVNLSIG